MKVLDQGHIYYVRSFDGGIAQTLTFMKREGDGYPGSVATTPAIALCIAALKARS